MKSAYNKFSVNKMKKKKKNKNEKSKVLPRPTTPTPPTSGLFINRFFMDGKNSFKGKKNPSSVLPETRAFRFPSQSDCTYPMGDWRAKSNGGTAQMKKKIFIQCYTADSGSPAPLQHYHSIDTLDIINSFKQFTLVGSQSNIKVCHLILFIICLTFGYVSKNVST